MESGKMSDFRKFNRNYSQHAQNRAKLITELSGFLKWTPDQFAIENTADNLHIVEFFRKLNDILLTDDVDYDYHWTVFQVIDIAMNNFDTRQYLVDACRIITGISNYAVKASSSLIEEKQIQIWTLVDCITLGMNITLEEPHLVNLIDHLATSVKKPDLPKEIKLLQVSILSNLCFKNDVAVGCLLRFTKSKELLNSIQDDVVFWCKLAMAMARFDCTMFEFELMYNLKRIFDAEYFTGLVRCNDQRLLRNILDMLIVGFERDEHSRHIMQQFHFEESIGRVLTLIDNSEIILQNSEHMSSFLGIVNSILSVSNTSLESNLPQLLKLVINNCQVNVSPEAIKTVRLIASSTDVTDSQDLVPFIIQLIENTETHLNNLLAEFYQLLVQLHAKYPDIVNQVPKDIIVKLIDTDSWSFKLTDRNLPMHIYRLQWLFVYTNGDDSLRNKLTGVLTNKDVHFIFASGLRCSDQEICAITMKLIRSDDFPIQAVSKVLSGASTPPSARTDSQINCGCQCRPAVEIVRTPFSASLEMRLDNAIDRLNAKNENLNVSLNEYVNMLEYQNIIASVKEENLQIQLKAQSYENTLQSNQIGGLKLTIRNNLTKISQLESKLENLRKHSDVLKNAFDSLKSKYDHETTKFNDLYKKYEKQRHENAKTRKQNEDKIADLSIQYKKETEEMAANLIQLKKDHDRERSDLLAEHEKELERLKVELVEQHQRKEKKLKAAHEQDLQKYSAKSIEMTNKFDREKADLTNRHAKELQENIVKFEHLEKELAEKVRLINKYTKEIDLKNQTLAEKESILVETTKEVESHKQRAEAIAKLMGLK